jgi:hypothetical protein
MIPTWLQPRLIDVELLGPIAWLIALVAGPIYIAWNASRASSSKPKITWSPITIAVCAFGAQFLLSLAFHSAIPAAVSFVLDL